MPHKEKDISGYKTITEEFSCMVSFELGVDLSKIVLPGLTYLFKSGVDIESVDDIKNTDMSVLAAVVSNALMSTTGKEARRLATLLLANTSVVFGGKRVELSSQQDIDMVFQSRVGDMVKTLGFAIEVSFLRFFREKFEEMKKEIEEEEKETLNQSS